MPPPASHFVNRAGWLRAAVLGANDGIISTASLIVGVASAGAPRGEILTAAVGGLGGGRDGDGGGRICLGQLAGRFGGGRSRTRAPRAARTRRKSKRSS